MYYSIYPRLRVIFTYFPDHKTKRSLIEADSLSEFKNKLKGIKLLSRFPVESGDLRQFLSNQVFNFSMEILDMLKEPVSVFFNDFLRIYELQDIKDAVYGSPGNFLLFQEDIPDLKAIGEALANTPWEEGWKQGYQRFQNSGNRMDIEFSLETNYYPILLNSLDNLSWSDKRITGNFIRQWVILVNRLWYYRLSRNYDLEDFEIRQFLTAFNIFPEDMEQIKGLDKLEFADKFYQLCYNTFKREMYTMASILAFFHIFRIEVDSLLSIYKGLKYNVRKKLINNVVGEG